MNVSKSKKFILINYHNVLSNYNLLIKGFNAMSVQGFVRMKIHSIIRAFIRKRCFNCRRQNRTCEGGNIFDLINVEHEQMFFVCFGPNELIFLQAKSGIYDLFFRKFLN